MSGLFSRMKRNNKFRFFCEMWGQPRDPAGDCGQSPHERGCEGGKVRGSGGVQSGEEEGACPVSVLCWR
jgi:hypothetical protein